MTDELLRMHVDQLRETWQSRVLREAVNSTLERIFLAVFAEAYPGALKILLAATFPGFTDITRPFLRGYATVTRSGWVVCNMICTDGTIRKAAVYESQDRLLSDARNLADKLKLSDKDRTEMFDLLRKWIASDLRVGVNGERVLS